MKLDLIYKNNGLCFIYIVCGVKCLSERYIIECLHYSKRPILDLITNEYVIEDIIDDPVLSPTIHNTWVPAQIYTEMLNDDNRIYLQIICEYLEV